MPHKKALAHLKEMLLVAVVQVEKLDSILEPPKKQKRPKKAPHVKLILIKGGLED